MESFCFLAHVSHEEGAQYQSQHGDAEKDKPWRATVPLLKQAAGQRR